MFLKKQFSILNLYFYLPFLAWVVAGGILLLSFQKQELFLAVNSHFSVWGDIFMYYATWLGQGVFIVIALLILLGISSLRNWWYVCTALLCNVCPLLIQRFLKSWYNSPRPLYYIKPETSIHIAPEWERLLHYSFPSGHSMGAFSFFSFLSLLLPQQYRKYGLLFVLLALLVCYSRLYLAAHFFEDVYWGSIIGTVTTTVIFMIMEHYKKYFLKQSKTVL